MRYYIQLHLVFNNFLCMFKVTSISDAFPSFFGQLGIFNLIFNNFFLVVPVNLQIAYFYHPATINQILLKNHYSIFLIFCHLLKAQLLCWGKFCHCLNVLYQISEDSFLCFCHFHEGLQLALSASLLFGKEGPA